MYSKNSFKHFLFEKKIDSKLWDIPHLRNVKCFWTKTISFHLSDGSRSYQLLTTKLRSGKRLKLRLNGKMQFWPPFHFWPGNFWKSNIDNTDICEKMSTLNIAFLKSYFCTFGIQLLTGLTINKIDWSNT